MAWTLLSAANKTKDRSWPSARSGHGFTSAGGKLYVHGGEISDGSWDAVSRVKGEWAAGGLRDSNIKC